ncbi:lysoplasmalogenase [Ruminiclostridium herbifermentans]|uniref:Lysoplasmalogenase n=1 Tax=Ruminiclostridium herbifermentans TaxID=2488810 RepID=A0A4U7JH96_9FIRM|nr:lysoplasmalogenase [Ruminiclostridium herbifermentans]QNU66058.1 lysoplasmalogenase [Ruminiclostridium herbifermentans]
MNIILFILMLISAGNLIIVGWLKLAVVTFIFKCLSSSLFIATAIFSYKKNPSNTKFFALMLSGLVFSFGGDVFLALDSISKDFFAIGVASFGIGHIMYSLGYSSMSKISLKDICMFLCFFIPTFLTIQWGDFEFNGMKNMIIFYAVIISFMVGKSLSMLKFYSISKKTILLMVSGSMLFFASDFVLLFSLFYPNVSSAAYELRAVNLTLYYLGQGLLALSFAYPIKDNKEGRYSFT